MAALHHIALLKFALQSHYHTITTWVIQVKSKQNEQIHIVTICNMSKLSSYKVKRANLLVVFSPVKGSW